MPSVETEELFLKIYILVMAASVIPVIPAYCNCIGPCLGCILGRGRNIILSKTQSIRRERDLCTAVLVLPFISLITVYGIYSPSWLGRIFEAVGLPADGSFSIRLAGTASAFLIWVILRLTIRLCMRPRNIRDEEWRSITGIPRTFFVTLVSGMLVTAGICSLLNAGQDMTTKLILWEIGVIYTIFLLRETQVFAYYRGIFIAFLYLCTLEFLPTGLLMASAMI